jgi:predicted small lipoprotein YifL
MLIDRQILISTASLTVCTVMLCACGQTGPLYLPAPLPAKKQQKNAQPPRGGAALHIADTITNRQIE